MTHPPTNLQIWQQNLNRSSTSQHAHLHGPHSEQWDVYALQEPHIRPNKCTISTPKFYTVYPTTRFSDPDLTSRVITLVSTSINTGAWRQIPFPSPDVVVVQFTSPLGKTTLINIYNDCTH
ncbi:hypothetical protein EDD15DRAFT_2183713, partial [Pisolithus albus]